MLKTSSFALAAILGALFTVPTPAAAIDNGPCHKCVMEPIVVIGERPKKKSTQSQALATMQTTPPAQMKLRRN